MLLSPQPKKSKIEMEDETLKKLQYLSVSAVKTQNTSDIMDIDQERKRKRESNTKEGSNEVINKPTENLSAEKTKDPNLRKLPFSIQSIVEEGSEEYIVKGDGPCLLRTTAAHIYGDENEGPQLARDLNTHLSNNRDYNEEKISADFPLTVTVGINGEIAVFENSKDYFDWLQESRRAAYKWSSCVDIIALTNRTHMDIDVVVYEQGHVPEIKSFKPDPKFPWKEDDMFKPNPQTEQNSIK